MPKNLQTSSQASFRFAETEHFKVEMLYPAEARMRSINPVVE